MPDRPPGRDRDPDEQRDFAELARTGDRRLRNRLVERNAELARKVASQYRRGTAQQEDLEQVALLALVKAVDRFDPDHGVRFSTYASRTIEGELKRHFRDTSWSLHVPRSVKDLHVAVRRASEELAQTLGRSPSVRELADHLGVDPDDVVGAIGATAAQRPTSLDAPPDETPTDHLAALADEGDEAIVEARAEVDQLLAVLPPREREIVRLRFYERLSQDEIAERVGLSQMHVSRLLRKSFDEMRAHHEP